MHIIMIKPFFLVLSLSLQSFSFSQEVFKQPIIAIKGETHVEVTGINNIVSDTNMSRFEIRSGSFNINVSGLIDRSASRKIFISLFADVNVKNDLIIFSAQGERIIQYEVEGIPAGDYSGQYANNRYFTVHIKFKISAPGYSSYFLIPPVSIYVSPEGKVSYERSFISGTGYIENFKQARKMKHKSNSQYSAQGKTEVYRLS